MTTTLSAVIAEQISVIEALTPKSLANDKFRASLEELDLRTWAEANPPPAFRRFSISDRWVHEPPQCDGGDVTFEPKQALVAVSYPKDYRYGLRNRLDRDRIIDEDKAQIDYAIGHWGTGNMTDSSAELLEVEVEELESVVLLGMLYRVYFYRSTSGETYVATQNSSEQSFIYATATAADSYTVTIPKAMADTTYVVSALISTLPSGGMPLIKATAVSASTFTLATSGTVPIGTVFDLIVRDR